MSIAAGTKLGRYEIRAKIGEGGMGEVYRGTDVKLNRDVVGSDQSQASRCSSAWSVIPNELPSMALDQR